VDRASGKPVLWTSTGQPARTQTPAFNGFYSYNQHMSSSPARTAAFFDLDKTIIAKSSTLAFSTKFQAGGLLSRRAMLRSAYAQLLFRIGGADHDQMEKIRQFMSDQVRGWDVGTVREIVADTLHHVVKPLVYDEAVQLIEDHQAAGRDVIIVSTSGSEVVEPIGEMLGVDHVIATKLEEVDGHYTGEIEYYAYAGYKAKAMKQLADERGYDLEACYAYSDSITDVPMLESVGHPFAVNPDKDLRAVAKENQWPILVFTKPVALRSRVPAKPTLAALAVGGAVAGAVWLTRKRRVV
jgi:HAD superfamily hydrolase (TIGR01490 family)